VGCQATLKWFLLIIKYTVMKQVSYILVIYVCQMCTAPTRMYKMERKLRRKKSGASSFSLFFHKRTWYEASYILMYFCQIMLWADRRRHEASYILMYFCQICIRASGLFSLFHKEEKLSCGLTGDVTGVIYKNWKKSVITLNFVKFVWSVESRSPNKVRAKPDGKFLGPL
jgi:hypothetical protein